MRNYSLEFRSFMKYLTYPTYLVVSQRGTNRHIPYTSATDAAYAYDTLGALTGWAMLLGVDTNGKLHIIERKGE